MSKPEHRIFSETVLDMVWDALRSAVRYKAEVVHFRVSHHLSVFKILRGTELLYQLPPQMGDAVLFALKITLKLEDLSDVRRKQMDLKLDGEVHRVVLRSIGPDSSYGFSLWFLAHRASLRLDQLGFSEKQLADMKNLIAPKSGLLLFSGSGRLTAMDAVLRELSPHRKCLTIDSVDFPGRDAMGVEQLVFAGESIGESVDCLRKAIATDAEVVSAPYVFRDFETFQLALDMAKNRLVLATLYTQNAASTLVRLIEIGLEPSETADRLLGALACRVLNQLCPDCRQQDKDSMFDEIYKLRPFARSLYGCRRCRNTGELGQTGLYEVLVMNDELRELVAQLASSAEIHRTAHSLGMRTFREGMVELIESGVAVEQFTRALSPLRLPRD